MRPACVIAQTVLHEVCEYIRPGLTTRQVDEFAAARIAAYGARSAFLGYRKFPCHTCISVNEQVVHGVAGDRRLKFGDIVSLDVGVKHQGFIGDTARTGTVASSGHRPGHRREPGGGHLPGGPAPRGKQRL
jgi:methionyl aminopeptidase